MSIKVPTEAPLCMLASRLLCIRLTTQRNGYCVLLEKDGEALKGIQVSFRKGAMPLTFSRHRFSSSDFSLFSWVLLCFHSYKRYLWLEIILPAFYPHIS